MQFPERLTKFNGNRTIRVPSEVHVRGADMDGFNFKRLSSHYRGMRAGLAAMGKSFTGMGWEQNGGGDSFVTWVGEAENPFMIWQKYVAQSARGAQNLVFLRNRPGQEFKATYFDHPKADVMYFVRLIEDDELRLFMIEQDLLKAA